MIKCLNTLSQVVLVVKNLRANTGDVRNTGLIPGSGRSPGGGNGNLSSILAWEIPWTVELGGLHGVAESDTTEHTDTHTHTPLDQSCSHTHLCRTDWITQVATSAVIHAVLNSLKYFQSYYLIESW